MGSVGQLRLVAKHLRAVVFVGSPSVACSGCHGLCGLCARLQHPTDPPGPPGLCDGGDYHVQALGIPALPAHAGEVRRGAAWKAPMIAVRLLTSVLA